MSRRLLVVDDEPFIRDALARHFRMSGLEVETACDGLEAVDRLSGGSSFGVVVTDIAMPRLDGIGLLERVRREHPTLGVVVITGFVTLENAVACARLGAETCIFKPFRDLSELDAAVESAFARHERWRRKILELRGLADA